MPIGRAARASYACNPYESRGRVRPEAPSPTRTEFQRDRDRILHSTGFRRLAYKTQVFSPIGDDRHRTRLTHTIEVGQIARALARGLGLDDDLAEAVALSHDLGHTPFGHAGEDALDAVMRPYGGFDHNAQALRMVTHLERRYALFDGLNLSWETLEGLVKHNGPLLTPEGELTSRYRQRGAPHSILDFEAKFPLMLSTHAGAEAQIAALADDIAYNAHDIDDGLRANLFTLEELRAASSFISSLLDEITTAYGPLDRSRVIHELVRRVITRFVEDALWRSQTLLAERRPMSADDIRAAPDAVIQFSSTLAQADAEIKAFLFHAMYRHPAVMRLRGKAIVIIEGLFAYYMDNGSALPQEWGDLFASTQDRTAQGRILSDYIAGMTDRYALQEYRRVIDAAMDLV